MTEKISIQVRDDEDNVIIAMFLRTIMEHAAESFEGKDDAYQAISELDKEEMKKYAVLGAHIVSAFEFVDGEARKVALKKLSEMLQGGNLNIPMDEDGEDVEEEYVRPAVSKPDIMFG